MRCDALTATNQQRQQPCCRHRLNAVPDGKNAMLPESAAGLAESLRRRGFSPIRIDLSELHKAGGSVKCCTTELHS